MKLRSTVLFLALAAPDLAQGEEPERVTFASKDGKTTLVGYLFKPNPMPAPQVPAVVMMHGRAGAYSKRSRGRYDAATLSQRHLMWGRLWSETGYIAILVDGFGPRGYWQGFARFSYQDRPGDVDEVSVRPLDAYGALDYLRARSDVTSDLVALQGWSNGGSAALSAMSVGSDDIYPSPPRGFRAAIAIYPACGLKQRFKDGYRPYAPVKVFHGGADEEVSPDRCRRFVAASRAIGGDIEIQVFRGATHGFDDPWQGRRNSANDEAAERTIVRARAFIATQFGIPKKRHRER